MPKAPEKAGLFGWRRGHAPGKLAGSYRTRGSRDESGIGGQVDQDAEGDSGWQDLHGSCEESGLSRSAVEQRVKSLARDLQTVVGVEWVDEDAVPTVRGMRARKDNYLEALEHYRPQRVVNTGKGSRALTDDDIEHAVAMTRQHSNCRIRDVALL